jgi:hypothetical protein
MVYTRPIPSSAGVQVDFDQAQYGGTRADGISFFLSDGSRQLTTTGATGAGLGYSTWAGQPGVAGGYLGVGLDVFGNFARNWAEGTDCGGTNPIVTTVPNVVSLRGPGDGTSGYCLLGSTMVAPAGPSTLPGTLQSATGPAAAVRNVRVTVSPGTFPTVTVAIDFTGTRTAYQTVLVHTMTDAAPPTYNFGFSASTGAYTDVHFDSRGETRFGRSARGHQPREAGRQHESAARVVRVRGHDPVSVRGDEYGRGSGR